MYRVIFVTGNKTYDLFCKHIYQSEMHGFVEIEGVVFNESETLVNPAEEKLRQEFAGVKRSFVPLYNLIRMDEVEHTGTSRVLDQADGRTIPFPGSSRHSSP